MIRYIQQEELPKVKLELCKPNKVSLGTIKNYYNLNMILRVNSLNELSFNIPYFIDVIENKENKQIVNPIMSKLKSLHLLKVEFNDEIEWFILSRVNRGTDEEGKKFFEIQMKSLGYQLRNKKIRDWAGYYNETIDDFQKEALTINEVVSSLMSYSIWSYSIEDTSLLNKLRNFSFTNTTLLDALINVAETYNAIIEWDTENKRIKFYDSETYFKDRGFSISYRKYLKSLSSEEIYDELITRLRIYGENGLSIQRVNPLGTDYIEDFSLFLEGYKEDDNGNVISHSSHMSDELCAALIKYKSFINGKEVEFQTVLNQISIIENDILKLESELFTLETEYKVLLDTIDVKSTQGQDYATELTKKVELEGSISNKRSQLSAKKNELSNKNNELTTLHSGLLFNNYLKNTLSMTEEEISNLVIELDNFIIEDVWEDQNYYDDKDLYNAGLKVFKDLNQIKNVLSIDIINFYQLLEGKRDWKRLFVGDIIKIRTDETNEKYHLLEINIDFEGRSISLQIANSQSILNNEDKLSDLIYDSIGTSGIVDMSKYKWDQIDQTKTEVDKILSNKWDAARNEITAGVNETVTINERGLTITDSNDEDRFIRATNSVIGLTKDGGDTFRTAITPDGVYAEEIVGKLMITENMYIENESGKYSFNHNGMTIDGGSLTITGGLPKEQLDPNFADGLFELDKNYTNGIRLDSLSGLTITRSDDKVKAIFNATDGIKFQTKSGTTWTDDFYYDVDNASLRVNGIINAKDLQVNGSSVLTEDKLKLKGNFIDKISTNQLEAGSAKITTAMIENLVVGSNVTMGSNVTINWGTQVTGKPFIPQNASDVGALPSNSQRLTYIDAYGLYTGTVEANKINAGTITGVTITGGTITGSEINVDTNVTVGDYLYLGEYEDYGTDKRIYFNSRANISGGDGLVGADITVNADTFHIRGTVNQFYNRVDFSGATVTGLTTTAVLG